ncbi:MAG: hypothetical protein V2A73_01440 [Pseudomonadota bacterium]
MYYQQWRPYVSVGERRRQAEQKMESLRKKGHSVSPVVIDGRTIARTFWGKAWCDNLEHYSDYANRLPRGRTYVRNGSVVDLQIEAGKVSAYVSGSDLYKVAVQVSAISPSCWTSVCADCTGAIDSLVELLQGRFSKGVMERICRQKTGLFPTPTEIKFSCSCPDWASMCKHVAAVLYGIGARLDEKPELLFRLRKVDEKDLIAKVGQAVPLSRKGPADGRVLPTDNLSELFGLDMDSGEGSAPPEVSTLPARQPARQTKTRRSASSAGSARPGRVTKRAATPAQAATQPSSPIVAGTSATATDARAEAAATDAAITTETKSGRASTGTRRRGKDTIGTATAKKTPTRTKTERTERRKGSAERKANREDTGTRAGAAKAKGKGKGKAKDTGKAKAKAKAKTKAAGTGNSHACDSGRSN